MPIDVASVGAGLYDGKIKTSDGNVYDIYAIVSASGEVAQDETEVNGDDERKATFISNIREDLTISANGLSFDTIQAITGNTYSSSAGGIEIALGTDSQVSPPDVEVQAFTKAKDSSGQAATIKKTWHKVAIKTVQVSQEGESEFSMEMTGTAFQTDVDIEGNSLGSKRIATLQVIY